jgi:Family of unknown function (DUF6572)
MAMDEKGFVTNIYVRDSKVVFTINDPNRWGSDDRMHLSNIVKEVKAYLATFITGEIYDKYPAAKDKDRVIEIAGKYPPSTKAERVFRLLEKSSSFSFRFIILEGG